MQSRLKILEELEAYAVLLETTAKSNDNFYYKLKADAVRESVEYLRKHP